MKLRKSHSRHVSVDNNIDEYQQAYWQAGTLEIRNQIAVQLWKLRYQSRYIQSNQVKVKESDNTGFKPNPIFSY